jgi:thioredoxin reductase (NADPH)
MDYVNICTTVFTPIEYGACGLTEEDAIKQYGNENIITYHSSFVPLEWNYDVLNENEGYIKVVCNLADKEKVLGFHIISPNAGEITQGVGIAMKLGVTKKQLDDTVGIHPTCAEVNILIYCFRK